MSKVLLVSRDQVRARMAAPGIRCAEMARGLAAAGHAVTLSIPNKPELKIDDVEQVVDDESALAKCAMGSDAVIIGGAGHYLMPFPAIPAAVPRVVDLSFPLILEVLAVPGQRRTVWPPPTPPGQLTRRMSRYLEEADVLLCASEQQRQFYLGCLTMVRRLSDTVLRSDPTLRDLLRVVPFGCPADPPAPTGSGPRQRFAGIAPDDYLLLWSGGLADWYDPETVVKAVARAAPRLASVRLVFMGARPDDPHLPETDTSGSVRRLAADLGLLDRHVFFEDDWVPYEERANWLCQADAAIFASHPTVESELSVRSRFLDYVWCATPVLCTRGDTYADLVASSNLGLTVAAGDVEALADAVVTMANPAIRADMREGLAQLRGSSSWRQVLKPLVDWCMDPKPAPDRSVRHWPTKPSLVPDRDRLRDAVRHSRSRVSRWMTRP